MKLKKYRKKMMLLSFFFCAAMVACSKGEKKTDTQQNTEQTITEAVTKLTGNAVKEEPKVPVLLAKTDMTGDGIDDSVCVKELDEAGRMKGLYVTWQNDSGELSLEVPEYITITCSTESTTEFRISCDNLSLGTTRLAEEPAYGTLGPYLEKTIGMKKYGNLYKIDVYCDEVSLTEAENHNGTAFLFKGKIDMEEQELDVTWTLEYSLGEWLVTSVELPLWNISGTTTGWETARAKWSEMVKRNRYVGYLDEAAYYQDIKSVQDYDGDGMEDRIWRDLSDGESYTIRFGNGEECLITDDFNGSYLDCQLLHLTEEKTVAWFREAGMSTGGDWMKLYLFERTEEGLKHMELPVGPALRVEKVSEREIAFYWGEQEPVGTLALDSVSAFADLTTDEWLEQYISKENGESIFRLYGYDKCFMMDGSVPERKAIQWHTDIGDKWGKATFAWVTEYIDGAWQVTDVSLL